MNDKGNTSAFVQGCNKNKDKGFNTWTILNKGNLITLFNDKHHRNFTATITVISKMFKVAVNRKLQKIYVWFVYLSFIH